MNGVRVLLIVLVHAFMEQHRCSSFQVQMKGTFEQLALPRVTCYDHKIEAVFGPMVKTNVHIQGKWKEKEKRNKREKKKRSHS